MLPLCNPLISFFLPAEQVASTNMQVCNDITFGYPEASHYVFHATVSIQGCPYSLLKGGSNPEGNFISCSVTDVTSSAPLRDALVNTNEPPPQNCTGATHSYNLLP